MIRREKKRAWNAADNRLGLMIAATSTPATSVSSAGAGCDATPDTHPSSRLLQQLSDSCNKHQASHKTKGLENEFFEDEENIPNFCREALAILRGLLPRVEKHYRAAEPGHPGPTPLDVRHICDFYCNVIAGGFCPHAPHLFRLGKGGAEGM